MLLFDVESHYELSAGGPDVDIVHVIDVILARKLNFACVAPRLLLD